MGGKSTLLRSTCSAVIMAQVGCYVPAAQALLEPVDAIFTRIGEHHSVITTLLHMSTTAPGYCTGFCIGKGCSYSCTWQRLQSWGCGLPGISIRISRGVVVGTVQGTAAASGLHLHTHW
jgi:hypothetical protein